MSNHMQHKKMNNLNQNLLKKFLKRKVFIINKFLNLINY